MGARGNDARPSDLLWILAAVLSTLPWLTLRLRGWHGPPPLVASLSGLCIVGAAFLISWAAEVAQIDVSQSLAIAIIALIAVLPEYAVDIYFAWAAGKNPKYIHYPVANMTGGNRLLVGVGWPLVAFVSWWALGRRGREVQLGGKRSVEALFLGLATLYSFLLPAKSKISLLDSAALIFLFVLYARTLVRLPVEEPELVGPAAVISLLKRGMRRGAVVVMFLYSGASILLSAEPFAEALLEVAGRLGIERFIMVQWIAPLASESPELVVACYFAARGRTSEGLGTLVSSKVNQWTLLIASLPLVYSLSKGSPEALPLDARQREEVLLTAAQSAFAFAVLLNLSMSLVEALLLFLLFSTQLLLPSVHVRYAYSGAYLALLCGYLVFRADQFKGLLRAFKETVRAGEGGEGVSPFCSPRGRRVR